MKRFNLLFAIFTMMFITFPLSSYANEVALVPDDETHLPVDVMNVDGIGNFQFMGSCSLGEGQQVEVVGVHGGEVLVKYTRTSEGSDDADTYNGPQCPTGTLFFSPKGKRYIEPIVTRYERRKLVKEILEQQ